jgi:hypothetical protein
MRTCLPDEPNWKRFFIGVSAPYSVTFTSPDDIRYNNTAANGYLVRVVFNRTFWWN